MLTQEQTASYECDGYIVVKGLFSKEEVARYRDHFMEMRSEGPKPGDYPDRDTQSDDPLRRFPRMIHMHRWDSVSMDFMLDTRIKECLTFLSGVEPYAVQTMLYFKPPKARGQALHQDNMYLRVQPGTCMAAWLALDDCDEENGCMQVVAGSHRWDLLCNIKADSSLSFTDITVPLPPNPDVRSVLMEAGDTLFFNGSLVHGSLPNTTTDRFRRALIGHYVEGQADQVAQFYHPVLRFDGTEAVLNVSSGGDMCGVWVDREGEPAIEMRQRELVGAEHE